MQDAIPFPLAGLSTESISVSDRFCKHGLLTNTGGPWIPGQCRLCWVDSVRHRMGKPSPGAIPPTVQRAIRPVRTTPATKAPSDCRFMGDELRTLDVAQRGLDTRKHWHNCEKGVNNGIVCKCRHCNSCELRFPEDNFTFRNLLYHIYPIRGNGIWQWNVDNLKKRINLFNGKRIIAVAINRVTDSMDDVKASFAGERIDEFIQIPNNPRLREVASWEPLWSRVRSLDENEITFYGHAKGVTRPFNPGSTIQRWVELLYEANLDYYPIVAKLLDIYPIAGALKKLGRGFQSSRSEWHYSGTFYWVRNRDFFLKEWRHIDQKWWGTESWPGVHFSQMEAGVIFGEGAIPPMDMYGAATFNPIFERFQQWKVDTARTLTRIGLLSDSTSLATANV